MKIGEMLVRKGVITREQLNEALAEKSRFSDKRLGEIILELCMVKDPLQFSRSLLDLAVELDKSSEQDRMKNEYLENVIHELRTPLSSIIGMAIVFKRKWVKNLLPNIQRPDEKTSRAIDLADESMDIIISEGERLASLINDFLDMAKIESGKFTWNMENVQVDDIMGHAFRVTSPLLQQKDLKAVMEVADGLPVLSADRERLVQVLINLISNAVKFTSSGTITCRARLEGDEVRVSVIDTGTGICPEDHGRIFEKFRQAGGGSGRIKGTGLGLPICKQIIEHHGGKIWVESAVGKGGNFTFSLPVFRNRDILERIANADSSGFIRNMKSLVSAGEDKTAKNILLVDDDINVRFFLRNLLEQEGYIITEAKDGIEAISIVKKEMPDIILLDVLMPGLNGYDVAAVLRNDPFTRDIPIIIISALQDRNRMCRLGIDAYFSKPIDPDRLPNEVERLANREEESKKVLVVKMDGGQCDDGLKSLLSQSPGVVVLDGSDPASEKTIKAIKKQKEFEDVVFIVMK